MLVTFVHFIVMDWLLLQPADRLFVCPVLVLPGLRQQCDREKLWLMGGALKILFPTSAVTV